MNDDMLGAVIIFGGAGWFLGLIGLAIVNRWIYGEVKGKKDFRGNFDVLKQTRVTESRRRQFGYSDKCLMTKWLESENKRRRTGR